MISRKFRRRLGNFVLPSLAILLSLAWLVVSVYWSRSVQVTKYALPTDQSAASMMSFLRRLDSEYEPRSSMFNESNLPAIHKAVQKATELLEQNSAEFSPNELREAAYYRLRFGYLSLLLSGDGFQDDKEWNVLLTKTRRFLNEATEVSSKESGVAGYAIEALDTYGRTSEAIELAASIEDKFRGLPDGQHKAETLVAIGRIRHRLQMLGSQLELKANSLDGNVIDLQDFRGKVVLVEFITTTCGHCIADFPAMKRIYKNYHGQGFEIISICLHASKAKIGSFVKEHQLPWIQVCDDPIDGNDQWATPFGISSFPTTMLIDQTGKVIKFGVRPLAHGLGDDLDLEENLEQLLPEG